ncbi:MAG: ATP-binding protein [Cyanobacteria bacterium]|nr:ATP-binding protein [Cyanobacteriota bacterium]MDA1021600.1 ATP-binding protein [Cyanobacteriota bacterium]
MDIKRKIQLKLIKGRSAFLFGPRKTGKTTYLKKHFPKSIFYDLLKTDLYLDLIKQPSILREEVLSLSKEQTKYPIIIDEIQKIPMLLDEVHWLIENTNAYFILCGSSARKLKKTSANMLGGRALRFEFFPLVYPELPEFDLIKIFKHGLLPEHYQEKNPKRILKAYLQTYLKEEIKDEGLVRNLPAFANFLDSLAFSNTELTNYSNIARDCGVDSKTVKEYYQILIDTLIGSYVYPYSPKQGRDSISSSPKFYLFDVGLANHIAHFDITQLKGKDAGKALENYIFMELQAYRSLNELDFDIRFWRTKSDLEVDFVITNLNKPKFAIEVKISSNIDKTDLRSLRAFKEENPNTEAIVVCNCARARKLQFDNDIEINLVPVEGFLKKLWSGGYF